jgi:hypothetical protein
MRCKKFACGAKGLLKTHSTFAKSKNKIHLKRKEESP